MKKVFTHAKGVMCIAMPPVFSKAGFTLAEVLITLGIIGVVAAMTIPTLIANTVGNKYRSSFKKAVSTLSQAARMNKANYDWDFADVNIPCNQENFQTHMSETHMSVCAIFNSNLSSKQSYYRENTLNKIINYEFKGNTIGLSKGGGQYTIYSLADGTLFGVRSSSFSSGCSLPTGKKLSTELTNGNLQKCTGFIDVNGFNLPNEETKCSIGTTTKNIETDCIVKNKDIKDIFPIVFHDSIVEGATNASRYILQTTK
uniref:Prepilin-type N-terminal cleavage/methylation domain-containing protein n=1 Tax=uncultured Candidatus Melainabacteria bacterium TaxID=2682970 RepID=A0A650EJ36_9BACT|nr:hypothetical protein Melaina855_1070 [uncultured Candidatus Melainabacteria bacterium]